jgi:hypothetical protein
MGWSAYCYVIVGEKFVVKNDFEEVLRYDEKTGKPYKLKQKVQSIVLESDHSIELESNEEDEWEFLPKEIRVFDYDLNFRDGEWAEDAVFFRGIEVCCLGGDDDNYWQVDNTKIDEAKETYKSVYGREPQVWHVMIWA